jgi:uncharacterized protein YcfJ
MKFLNQCIVTLLVSSAVGFTSSLAFAESYTVQGVVTSSTPKYKLVNIQNPVNTCEMVQVPIYGTAEQEGGDIIGSLIIGSLIGGAIGNNVSDADGAGAAGAVLGGIIGANEATKKKSTNNNIIGYREQEKCKTTWINSQEEHLSHYSVEYEVLGLKGTKITRSDVPVGSKIPVVVSIKSN